MPPAAPDDLILRQHSRSLEDDPPFTSDQSHPLQEHEPSGKSKKKKSKKAKAAKAAVEVPDDLIQPSPPAPAEPSSCPDPRLDHHVHPTVTSPALDVLGSLDGTAENDLTSRTDSWAQAVPYGKSPPADLMDGELPNESPLNFPTIQERGAFSGFSQPSSASPPTRIRPFSYGSGFRSSMQSRQQSADRRKSHSYGSPMGNMAPPPHMPQAHFYGAPDIDLPTQIRLGAEGAYSFCGLDSLPNPSIKSLRSRMNVLMVGTDGAVDVLAVEDRRSRLIGKITGLNGRVLEAKILPGTSVNDALVSSQPHVAVIVHGPLPPNDEEGRTSLAGSEVNDVPPSMVRGPSSDRRTVRDGTPSYQTRVEVYSLRSGEHVATLFTSKPVPSLENIPGLPSLAPPPVGSLKLFIGGNHVLVASGISGEIYIYRQASGTYQCLGKTWTNVQTGESRRYSTSSSSTDPDGSHSDLPRTPISDRPILTVQGRWLATVPPSSSHRGSIQGTVPANLIHGRAQGLETRSPPTIPSVNCATDVGEGESFFDKVARGVTQELVRGARWMGDQGMQAWNNYWNNQQSPGTPPQRPTRGPDFPAPGYGLFPPTHAQDTQSTSSPDPDAVSIIDLKRFDESIDTKAASLHPMATFQVLNGCSFLSLSPNGLMLFTASKKGDVQYVWDLMQLKHCRAMAFMTDDHTSQSPNVRQVARYARLTTSSIVDVIWTPPVGDRLAIITRKGTVHVFDLPRSAFQWPPFRRARAAAPKSPTIDPTGEEMTSQATGGNPLSAAMKLVGGKTQPFFSAVRGRVPSSGAAFPNMSGFALPAAASIKGGKVVAAGLSKSMGAAATGTVHTIRHVGENRLHLSGLARDPAPSRVIWICNKGLIFLGVVDDGNFKLYRLKRGPSSHKNRQFHSVIGGKESQYRLPANLQSPCGPAPRKPYDPEQVVQASLFLPSASSQPSGTSKSFCHPLSQAEIETNTPYQPFHTDQRVGLHVFSTGYKAVGPTLSVPGGQWVFGDDIPTTKVHVRSYSNSSDDPVEDDEDAAIHGHSLGAGGDMENLITLGNSTGNVEEVVITTRRKKKHSAPLKTDDGFFEDDCEVLDFARDRV
ncbi:uncharacterized protein N7459_007811 [Penicillium hispanicum]|uniref:uncharacterized protein n=1 Tax=Penicillium hispanicum TaxID=1080232 RepID=UPI00254124D9|nr:uncharacterized protein N7459_007811 [Penicillium hispanicum]KAJ5573384.1 hypothetical protein N7459_007811 [Penicillium hispanicum]